MYESPNVTRFLICPGAGPRAANTEVADRNPTMRAVLKRDILGKD